LKRRYDLVLFSGVLQYLPDWPATMRRAADAAVAYLLITDVPAVRGVPGFVATQRNDGERTLYQSLNRDELVDTIQRAGLRLVREFELGPHPRIAHAPEQPTSMGWLFQRV
jgi:putative methyltransferase (TIGR04325 family)